MPLHVSSTMCSPSGGQNCIIQHLVSSYLYVTVRCTVWERTAGNEKILDLETGRNTCR